MVSISQHVTGATTSVRLFDGLQAQPADPLLGLIGMIQRDPRAGKIDVGIGVYRDALGETPIMNSVKAAEARLLTHQVTKAYLGAEGDIRFADLLAVIAFGAELAASDRLIGVQTPGGTGALRLGAELVALARPDSRIWIGKPTWPNHAPLFQQAGLGVRIHRYYDAETSEIDFDGMMSALQEAAAGDLVLLHGCCHNPTGTGFTTDQWHALSCLLVQRGLIPFLDLAYQGLGDGLDEDVAGLRLVLNAVPEALVAYSCDKNFGLYRERVGALWVLTSSPITAKPARDNMLVLARALWSMPPDHGAAIVRIILDDAALTRDWRAELAAMRERINQLRSMLAAAHPKLAPLSHQRGLFAMLPISAAAIATLREQHGIYMADSGRINTAGLSEQTITPFAAALAPFLSA